MDAHAEPPLYTRSPSPSNYLSSLPSLYLCLSSFLYLPFAPITSTLTPLSKITLPLLYSLDSANLHTLYIYILPFSSYFYIQPQNGGSVISMHLFHLPLQPMQPGSSENH